MEATYIIMHRARERTVSGRDDNTVNTRVCFPLSTWQSQFLWHLHDKTCKLHGIYLRYAHTYVRAISGYNRCRWRTNPVAISDVTRRYVLQLLCTYTYTFSSERWRPLPRHTVILPKGISCIPDLFFSVETFSTVLQSRLRVPSRW